MLVIGVLLGLQRQFVYFPQEWVPSPPEGVEPVTTTTDDDLALDGWLVRDHPGQPLLIVFHGNGGNRAGRLPLASALKLHGIAVLLTDYRGYGGNPGRPTEEGLRRDAEAWRQWADAHHAGPITYFGESLGSAVAARLALSHRPAALVLRSPFPSLAAVGAIHYPLLPLRWLLLDRYETAAHLDDLDVPLLVVAGARDGIVPVELSRAVYDAAAEPKRWLEVPGARHNDLTLLAGDQLVAAVVDLVAP